MEAQEEDKKRRMNDFEEYLEERYDNIDWLYCLKVTEDGKKVCCKLTFREALHVWGRLFGDE